MRARPVIIISILLPLPLRGGGYEAFQSPLKIGGVLGPVSLSAGDFNRDGKLDLAAATGTGKIAVALQDPLNRAYWKLAPFAQAGSATFHVRAADFDGDGTDDLVVADPGSSAWLLRSKGDGTFEP